MGRESVRRRAAAILGALLIVGVASRPAAAGPIDHLTVTRVHLTPVDIAGNKHTYEAEVFDAGGTALVGATLDIGGLGDDPDLRAVTTPMIATAANRTQYRATLAFPADGDWMLVVRVHTPSEKVELITTRITGAGARPSHHDLSANPSRRAVLRDDPTFFARYDPANTTTSGGATVADNPVSHAHLDTIGAVSVRDTLDPGVLAFSLLHGLGAIAWIVSVGGLVLANRVGPGDGRNHLYGFIADRYLLLAGGGLLTVVLSGLQLAQHASAGLTDPRALLRSGIGTAYLAVFAFKMALAAASIATSLRIGRMLPSQVQRLRSARLASVGAMADDGPPPHVLTLAEANAVFAVLIVVSVTALNQLHHVLH